jgi:hypothetical protein
MKHIWEFYIQNNMVDVLMWAVALFMSIRYGFMQVNKDRKAAQGWLFVFFLTFYGGFLIYRLGTMKWMMYQLVQLCRDSGIDISDIIPPGTY